MVVKNFIRLFIFSFILFFSLSLASAYYGYSYPYSYQKSVSYDKTTLTQPLPYGGYETTTLYRKNVVETPYPISYPRYIGSYYPKCMHNYDYSPSYDYSYWRNKPSYDPYVYSLGNKYGYGYYYEPRYSFSSGSYNWRY